MSSSLHLTRIFNPKAIVSSLARMFHTGCYVPRPAGFSAGTIGMSGGIFRLTGEGHDESSFELVKRSGFGAF
jgi:hypothetical protein